MMLSLQVIRKFSNTSSLMVRRLGKRANPGLGHQITEIEDASEVIQSDPEGFAGLESDLYNVHQSHKEHEFEMRKENKKIKQYIVKNKYFRKDPLPNLLTYAEKEQIRFLHSTDEEEWTVEKLAESFPANAEIICKILKARWSPLSAKRMQSHDASVLNNWEKFKSGEYKPNMTNELYEHLKKFSERENNIKISQDPALAFNKKQWQKPYNNEFSSIITSLKQKNIDAEESRTLLGIKLQDREIETDNKDSETYLLGEIKNKTPITFHELKKKRSFKKEKYLANKNASNNSVNQLVTQKLENSGGTGIVHNKNKTNISYATGDYTEKFISNEVIISEFDRNRYDMCSTKPRIYIPRKLRRNGVTYRTNNSYYDDDGEFLYTVPDMNTK